LRGSKESHHESDKKFVTTIAALLAAVSVRGQENVEAVVAQNVRPILLVDGKSSGVGSRSAAD
jgi:hypothetical protein